MWIDIIFDIHEVVLREMTDYWGTGSTTLTTTYC